MFPVTAINRTADQIPWYKYVGSKELKISYLSPPPPSTKGVKYVAILRPGAIFGVYAGKKGKRMVMYRIQEQAPAGKTQLQIRFDISDKTPATKKLRLTLEANCKPVSIDLNKPLPKMNYKPA